MSRFGEEERSEGGYLGLLASILKQKILGMLRANEQDALTLYDTPVTRWLECGAGVRDA